MKMDRVVFGLLSILSIAAYGQQNKDYSAEYEAIPLWSPSKVTERAEKGQYVFLDRDAGQFVLAYPTSLRHGDSDAAPSQSIVIKRFNLNNQVMPSIAFNVVKSGPFFEYHYSIKNEESAKQSIWQVAIPTPEFRETDTISGPFNWRAVPASSSINAIRIAIGKPDGVFLSWYAFDEVLDLEHPEFPSIKPGETMGEFSVTSALKPGFTISYSKGGNRPTLTSAIPTEVLEQLVPVMQLEYSSKNTITIGPKFEADAPQSKIAEDYKHGIQRLIDSGQLNGTSSFVKQTLRTLEICIETSRWQSNATGCELDFDGDIKISPGLERNLFNALQLGLAP